MRRGWANRHDAGGWSSKYPARKSGAQERIALIQTEDIEIVRLFLSRTAIVYQRRYTQARQSLSRSHSFGPSLMVTNSVPMCWLTLSVRSDDDGAGPKSCRCPKRGVSTRLHGRYRGHSGQRGVRSLNGYAANDRYC